MLLEVHEVTEQCVVVVVGKFSNSVQYAITGPCHRMRHRPSA